MCGDAGVSEPFDTGLFSALDPKLTALVERSPVVDDHPGDRPGRSTPDHWSDGVEPYAPDYDRLGDEQRSVGDAGERFGARIARLCRSRRGGGGRPTVISKAHYERELTRLQIELVRMQEWIVHEGLRVMVIFEGRYTAGKGGPSSASPSGSTPRLPGRRPGHPDRTRADAVVLPALRRPPPAAGEMVLFDRSWYNRAGVERVMEFCTAAEQPEFFRTCPQLERALVRSGIILVKYWLSLSDEEQERRFTERINNPGKRWKLSPMDLEARARWVDYAEAKDEMFAYTDIKEAPWYVVDANDKKAARLNVISHLLKSSPTKPSLTRP